MEEIDSTPERNIEEDKCLFAEAISSISIEEIPTEFNEVSVQNILNNLEQTKIFILGEMHGVKENVDIIYTLFKKFGFRQLALEWKPSLQIVADKFLESGELDFDAIKDSPDGRITAGHFALLRRLKDEGLLEQLVCFDEGSGREGWNARDLNMAKNIISNLSNSPTLVMAGNLHTKTEPFNFKNESEEMHPMGENVKKEISDLISGEIEYLSGQYHNFGTQEFSIKPDNKSSQARFYQSEQSTYVFEIPEAHVAIVPNPNEKI